MWNIFSVVSTLNQRGVRHAYGEASSDKKSLRFIIKGLFFLPGPLLGLPRCLGFHNSASVNCDLMSQQQNLQPVEAEIGHHRPSRRNGDAVGRREVCPERGDGAVLRFKEHRGGNARRLRPKTTDFPYFRSGFHTGKDGANEKAASRHSCATATGSRSSKSRSSGGNELMLIHEDEGKKGNAHTIDMERVSERREVKPALLSVTWEQEGS